MNDTSVQFVCIDCNCTVFSWTEVRERCAVCQWIHDQPDLTKEEIAEIRVLTATPILGEDDGYEPSD